MPDAAGCLGPGARSGPGPVDIGRALAGQHRLAGAERRRGRDAAGCHPGCRSIPGRRPGIQAGTEQPGAAGGTRPRWPGLAESAGAAGRQRCLPRSAATGELAGRTTDSSLQPAAQPCQRHGCLPGRSPGHAGHPASAAAGRGNSLASSATGSRREPRSAGRIQARAATAQDIVGASPCPWILGCSAASIGLPSNSDRGARRAGSGWHRAGCCCRSTERDAGRPGHGGDHAVRPHQTDPAQTSSRGAVSGLVAGASDAASLAWRSCPAASLPGGPAGLAAQAPGCLAMVDGCRRQLDAACRGGPGTAPSGRSIPARRASGRQRARSGCRDRSRDRSGRRGQCLPGLRTCAAGRGSPARCRAHPPRRPGPQTQAAGDGRATQRPARLCAAAGRHRGPDGKLRH